MGSLTTGRDLQKTRRVGGRRAVLRREEKKARRRGDAKTANTLSSELAHENLRREAAGESNITSVDEEHKRLKRQKQVDAQNRAGKVKEVVRPDKVTPKPPGGVTPQIPGVSGPGVMLGGGGDPGATGAGLGRSPAEVKTTRPPALTTGDTDTGVLSEDDGTPGRGPRGKQAKVKTPAGDDEKPKDDDEETPDPGLIRTSAYVGREGQTPTLTVPTPGAEGLPTPGPGEPGYLQSRVGLPSPRPEGAAGSLPPGTGGGVGAGAEPGVTGEAGTGDTSPSVEYAGTPSLSSVRPAARSYTEATQAERDRAAASESPWGTGGLRARGYTPAGEEIAPFGSIRPTSPAAALRREQVIQKARGEETQIDIPQSEVNTLLAARNMANEVLTQALRDKRIPDFNREERLHRVFGLGAPLAEETKRYRDFYLERFEEEHGTEEYLGALQEAVGSSRLAREREDEERAAGMARSGAEHSLLGDSPLFREWNARQGASRESLDVALRGMEAEREQSLGSLRVAAAGLAAEPTRYMPRDEWLAEHRLGKYSDDPKYQQRLVEHRDDPVYDYERLRQGLPLRQPKDDSFVGPPQFAGEEKAPPRFLDYIDSPYVDETGLIYDPKGKGAPFDHYKFKEELGPDPWTKNSLDRSEDTGDVAARDVAAGGTSLTRLIPMEAAAGEGPLSRGLIPRLPEAKGQKAYEHGLERTGIWFGLGSDNLSQMEERMRKYGYGHNQPTTKESEEQLQRIIEDPRAKEIIQKEADDFDRKILQERQFTQDRLKRREILGGLLLGAESFGQPNVFDPMDPNLRQDFYGFGAGDPGTGDLAQSQRLADQGFGTAVTPVEAAAREERMSRIEPRIGDSPISTLPPGSLPESESIFVAQARAAEKAKGEVLDRAVSKLDLENIPPGRTSLGRADIAATPTEARVGPESLKAGPLSAARLSETKLPEPEFGKLPLEKLDKVELKAAATDLSVEKSETASRGAGSAPSAPNEMKAFHDALLKNADTAKMPKSEPPKDQVEPVESGDKVDGIGATKFEALPKQSRMKAIKNHIVENRKGNEHGLIDFPPGLKVERVIGKKVTNQVALNALSFVGEHEGDKGVDNPRLAPMFRAYGLTADRDGDGSIQDDCPWCTTFVSHSIRMSDKSFPRIAGARKFLSVGTNVKEGQEKEGDILVMWNDNIDTGGYSGPGGWVDPKTGKRRYGWGGHNAILLKVIGDEYIVVNGNKDDAVRISSVPKSRVIGRRRLK